MLQTSGGAVRSGASVHAPAITRAIRPRAAAPAVGSPLGRARRRRSHAFLQHGTVLAPSTKAPPADDETHRAPAPANPHVGRRKRARALAGAVAGSQSRTARAGRVETSQRIVAIAAAKHHTVCADATGAVLCCGLGVGGRLGITDPLSGEPRSLTLPVAVRGFSRGSPRRAVMVAAGLTTRWLLQMEESSAGGRRRLHWAMR